MEIGTSIFLASALLALVLLYGFTKDRWRWRKVIERTLFVGLLCVAGVLGAAVILQHWDQMFPAQVGRQTQYAGVKLGMTPHEVMYIKGYPPVVLADDPDPAWKDFFKVIKTGELDKGKKVTDYEHWSYEQYHHNINVVFNQARTAVIGIVCYSDDKIYRCPSIGNVTDGTTEEDALRKLGRPTEERLDGVSKALRFRDLGVKLTLTRQQVYMLEVYDPQSSR